MTTARRFFFLYFFFSASGTWAVISPIAITGDNVPGIPGAQFASFGDAQLNANGDGVYFATLDPGTGGVSASNDRVLMSFDGGSTLLARTGSDNVPGAAGASYSNFLEFKISLSGDVLLKAELASSGSVTGDNNRGLWKYSHGAGSLIARKGTSTAPGSPAPFEDLGARVGTTSLGDFAFNGQLQYVNGVSNHNDFGVWRYGATSGTLVVQENNPAPGVAGGLFQSFTPPAINSSLQIAFRGSVKAGPGLTDANRVGVWTYNQGALGELLARNGSGEVPGSTSDFRSFDDPFLDEAGHVFFRATLASGQQGLWRYEGTEGTNLAMTNVPGVPGIPGVSFANLSRPLLMQSGRIVTVAGLNIGVGGVVSGNDAGIWLLGDETGGKLLAREGMGGVAGVAGASYASFEQVAAVDDVSVYVNASLQTLAGVVDSTNDEGIWRIPFDGTPQIIVRRGDILAGRTVADVWLPAGPFDEVPLKGISNAAGELLFHASFTNGDAGLFIYSPSTATEFADADFDRDGDVDATDLVAWQEGFSVGPAGDTDNDGDTDGADFLTWQRQYTGAESITKVRAVPEPSVALLLGIAIVAAQGRTRTI